MLRLLWAGHGSSSAGLGWDHSTTSVGWWVAWGLSEDESLCSLWFYLQIGCLGFFGWQGQVLPGLLLSLGLLGGPLGTDPRAYTISGALSVDFTTLKSGIAPWKSGAQSLSFYEPPRASTSGLLCSCALCEPLWSPLLFRSWEGTDEGGRKKVPFSEPHQH